MDAQIKAKWIEALRGDKYEQNRNGIGQGERLCCIGVGGRVVGLRDTDALWFTLEVGDRLGLSDGQRRDLVSMNDEEGKSFAEIADYIESSL